MRVTRASGLLGSALLVGSILVLHQYAPAAAQEMQTPTANPSADWFPVSQLAGATQPPKTVDAPDPYSGDQGAIEQGHKMFVQMNCANCHGYDAMGGMGPNLTDQIWRHGG